MFDWIADPNAWLALGTLTSLEIVLGMDNIIFPHAGDGQTAGTSTKRRPSHRRIR